jgi:methylmalonyl-CoA mutase
MLLAASAGGAEVVSVLPHNTSDLDFGLRIARNISHLLIQEGYTNTTIEMAKGSWYLDELTHKLASAAWELFLTIESKGGYFASLANGFIAELCQDSAEKRTTAYEEGKEVLIGANANPLPNPMANSELPWTIHSTTKVLTPKYLAY